MGNNELHFVMYKLKAQELIKFNVHIAVKWLFISLHKS